MDEKTEKETEKAKQEVADGDSKKGDKPESTSILDRVVKENERMESNIKRQEEIISKQEEVAAKQILGGVTEAGKANKKTQDELDEEAAKDFMKDDE